MVDAASLQARGVVSRYFDRVLAPAETLAAMRPRLADFGITRLARLTGLDEVGIPVWAAIRPNAATLAVSQGKGVDDDAAAASAMMEAIEVATAERRDLPRLTLSPRAMAASGRRAAQLTELLRVGASPPAPDEPIDWIEGFDLMDDAPVWVPLDAVRLGEAAAQARYWQSTDGLASGNVLWEAAFHGLCERVERDALTLWSLAGDAEVGERCRDPRDFDDPELAALVGQDRGGRTAPAPVRHFDRRRDSRLLRHDLAAARQRSGALAPFRPAERQRLPSRSGARRHSRRHRSGAVAPDRDLRRARRFRSRRLSRAHRARPVAVRPGRAVGRRAGAVAAVAPADYIGHIASRLRAIGVGSAIVVPLESGERGFAVAKALVADLETVPGARRFPLGPRALRAKLAQR